MAHTVTPAARHGRLDGDQVLPPRRTASAPPWPSWARLPHLRGVRIGGESSGSASRCSGLASCTPAIFCYDFRAFTLRAAAAFQLTGYETP
eukprot:1588143-Alexandrium_andersonii.AAC.1